MNTAGMVTYLAGISLIVGAALLAVAALLGLSPYLTDPARDFGAVFVLVGCGVVLLHLGTH